MDGKVKFKPQYYYGLLFLVVLVMIILINLTKNIVDIYLFSAFVVPMSFYIVYKTDGSVFFFEKDKFGKYNLLYVWSVLSAGLIIHGAEVLNVMPFLNIFLCTLIATLFILGVTYIALKKFWNGKDSFLSVATASMLMGFGFVLNYLN